MDRETINALPARVRTVAVMPDLITTFRLISKMGYMLGAECSEQVSPILYKLADDVAADAPDDPFAQSVAGSIRGLAIAGEAVDKGMEAFTALLAGDVDEELRQILGD